MRINTTSAVLSLLIALALTFMAGLYVIDKGWFEAIPSAVGAAGWFMLFLREIDD